MLPLLLVESLQIGVARGIGELIGKSFAECVAIGRGVGSFVLASAIE